MNKYQDEMNFALNMVEEASKLILPYFQTALKVESKADQSPVTIADQKSEELLRTLMQKHTPSYGIIGEEFGTQSGSEDRQWVVDPIDGTKAFIYGVPLFGTLLALLEKGKPILGVVAMPALGHILAASLGNGCTLDDNPCHVSSVRKLSEALILDGSITTMERLGYGNAWATLRRNAKLHRGWGDCYGHLLVATGCAEVMADPIVSIWDVAPFAIILPEAGGRFTSFSGTDSITEQSGISSNGLLHHEVQSALVKDA